MRARFKSFMQSMMLFSIILLIPIAIHRLHLTIRKEALNAISLPLQTEMQTLSRKEKKHAEKLRRVDEEIGDMQKGLSTIKEEAMKTETKMTKTVAEIQETKQTISTVKKNLEHVSYEREKIDNMEKDLNERLAGTMEKLLEVRADKRESERKTKFRESLASLKRIFPGVHGRIVDICKPTQKKYEQAVSIILGRNMDAIVVETEKTAIACIEVLLKPKF